jgi:hypothetical protein
MLSLETTKIDSGWGGGAAMGPEGRVNPFQHKSHCLVTAGIMNAKKVLPSTEWTIANWFWKPKGTYVG